MRKELRLGILVAVAAVAFVGSVFTAPIPQDPRYHRSADGRSILGIPNFWNVLSNAPFLLTGLAGMVTLRRARWSERQPVYPSWAMLFLGVGLVAFGSAWYHLAPDNPRLAWDRLPMTVAFMSLLAVVIGEWIEPKCGRRLLPLLLLIGLGSVIYWLVRDDLRPYILVQFLPLLIIPMILLFFPSRAVDARLVWGALAAYAVAKVLEILDEPVYRTLRIVSGHTLKHLVSAAGALLLVVAAQGRPGLRTPRGHVRSGPHEVEVFGNSMDPR